MKKVILLTRNEGIPLGPELVVNGDFSSASGWTTESNWSIGGGTLNGSSAVAETYRTDTATISGTDYMVEFEITSYTSGSVRARMGGTGGTDRTGVGIYKEIITAGAGGRKISIDGVLGFTGAIDNVSVKEVL